MSLFYWVIAIVGFLVGFIAYSLCVISSRCSRQEEALERQLLMSPEQRLVINVMTMDCETEEQ